MKAEGIFSDWQVYIEDEDGKRLNEYPVVGSRQGDGPPTMTCYLETPEQDGKHFKIVVEPPAITTIYHDVQAKFKVDSRLLDGMIIHMSQKRKVEKSTVHETVAGVTHERKLAFGRLSVTADEDIALKDKSILQDLGQIEVQLEQGWGGSLMKQNWKPLPFKQIGSIHEQSKKAVIDRAVVMGESKVVTAPRYINWTKSPGMQEPVFVFKYLSRSMLMARRIIDVESAPRDVSPSGKRKRTNGSSSNPVRMDVEEDDRETLIARNRELAAQLAELRGVKAERLAGKKRVKTKGGADIIDLSTD